MRCHLTSTLAVAVSAALALGAAAPAMAQVARPQAARITAPNDDLITPARWRGRGVGAGVAIGIGTGLLLGGILGAQPYNYGPYYNYAPYPYYGPPAVYAAPDYGDAVGYCMQRFKSYDPGSGTYLGYDGMRHPCP